MSTKGCVLHRALDRAPEGRHRQRTLSRGRRANHSRWVLKRTCSKKRLIRSHECRRRPASQVRIPNGRIEARKQKLWIPKISSILQSAFGHEIASSMQRIPSFSAAGISASQCEVAPEF